MREDYRQLAAAERVNDAMDQGLFTTSRTDSQLVVPDFFSVGIPPAKRPPRLGLDTGSSSSLVARVTPLPLPPPPRPPGKGGAALPLSAAVFFNVGIPPAKSPPKLGLIGGLSSSSSSPPKVVAADGGGRAMGGARGGGGAREGVEEEDLDGPVGPSRTTPATAGPDLSTVMVFLNWGPPAWMPAKKAMGMKG